MREGNAANWIRHIVSSPAALLDLVVVLLVERLLVVLLEGPI